MTHSGSPRMNTRVRSPKMQEQMLEMQILPLYLNLADHQESIQRLRQQKRGTDRSKLKFCA